MKRRILEYLIILLIAWGVPFGSLLIAATGNPVLVAVDLEDDDWIGISTGSYIAFDDTTDQFKVYGDLMINEATASLLLATDVSKNASSVTDLTTWVTASTGLTGTSDGDGTMTISITLQGVVDTLAAPGDMAGSDTIDEYTLETYLGNIQTKINEIIENLEDAGIIG